MDFALSEEQRHWGKVARKFAYESVRPRALELDRVADPSQTFPADLIREASRLGLRTLKIPKEYGGAGVDALTEVIVQEELSAGDVGLGMTLQHAWREGYILAAATTDAQRERFLPAFMNDDSALMAFSLSEEHAGSDHGARYAETLAAGPQTRAVREGDHWVINGHKRWTTNGNVAKFVILCARTDPGVPWPEGISMFVVPTDTPGYRVERVLDKVGIRLNQNTDTVFENCRIPADNLLGELNGGFAFLERFAAGSSAKEAAKALGVARAALEHAIEFASTRIQGGKPIIEHQAIGQLIGDLATEVEAARTLIWRAAWAVDHSPEEAHRLQSMAKLAGTEASAKVGVRSLEIFGGAGVLKSQPMEKLARDAISMLHAGSGNHAVRVRLAEILKTGGLTSLAPAL